MGWPRLGVRRRHGRDSQDVGRVPSGTQEYISEIPPSTGLPATKEEELQDLKFRNTQLHSDKNELESTIEGLRIDLRKAQEEIKTRRSTLNVLEAKIWELLQKLSRENQGYLTRNRGPSLLILQYSLDEFDRLEGERIEDQQKLLDKDEFHRKAMAQEVGRHAGEIERLKNGHCRIIEELREAHQREVGLKQAEINRLQNGLLTSVDRFQPLPDSTFKTRFTTLKKAVSDLARNATEGAAAGALRNAFYYGEFVHHMPPKHWKFLLESSFWDILVEGLFSTPFSVFGSHGKTFVSIWHSLFRKENDLYLSGSEWPQPHVASEHWRSVTFEALQQQVEAKSGSLAANEAIKKSYETHLQEITEDLSEELRKVSPDKPDAIRNIVDQACKLALEFGVQRCRLRLFSPQRNATVAVKSYSNENNDLDPAISKGVVQLTVAPGLRRTGDGRGYTFHEAVEIYNAAVYLGAP